MRVHLRNRGQDAYKPDVFGEQIVIERRLQSSGTNETKIKTCTGVPIFFKGYFCDSLS